MAEQIAHEKSTITFDRRAFFAVAGSAAVAGAGYVGYNVLPRSGSNNEAPVAAGGGDQDLGSSVGFDPTIEPTFTPTEEPLAEQGDIAMANPPILAHIEGVYGEGETTPGMYLEAGSIANLKRMFQIPDTLLEGPEGTHGKYINEVLRILGDVTKLGRTEEEIMEFMPPEFFTETTEMNSDQVVAHEAKINSAINNYVNAKVDQYADIIYETIAIPDVGTNKYEVSGYEMVVKLLEVSLQKFAEHVREYKNTAWKMRFFASNRNEDMRGDTVFVDANLASNMKGWSSNGEIVTNVTEHSKILFAGKSGRGGAVGTAFNASYSDDGQSFMEALEALEFKDSER